MIENLNILNNLKEQYVLDDTIKDYYLKLYKKLQNEITPMERKEIDKLLDNNYIRIFIEVMKKNNKEKYLNNLYSNLRVTKLVDKNFIKKEYGKEIYGVNIYKRGFIYLYLGEEQELKENNATLTPYHELLHLLSTKVVDKNILSLGLSSNSFGEGINEGYTECLTKRYFQDLGNEHSIIYYQHIWFMDMIEEIVGKEQLEDYYFSVNQDGLIRDLSRYTKPEKVIDIICNLDYLFENDEKTFFIQKELIDGKDKNQKNKELDAVYIENKELRTKTYNELFIIYKEKQHQLLNRKLINVEQFDNNIKSFIKKNEYQIKVLDNLEDDFKEYFEDNDKIKTLKRD